MSDPTDSSPPIRWASEATGADAFKREGLAIAESVSHQHWTDFNDHDPGVTMLEQFGYVLSDLSYRSAMPIARILAGAAAPTTSETAPLTDPDENLGFHPPKSAFPSPMVTADDWRKTLLDLSFVRNSWVRLTRPPAAQVSPAENLRTVLIEQKPRDFDGTPNNADAIVQGNYLAANQLNERRPVAETFETRTLQPNPILVAFKIHVLPGFSADEIGNALAQRLLTWVQPAPTLESLPEVLKRHTLEECFDGPPLISGVILETSLAAIPRRTIVRTSDLLQELARPPVPGIAAISEVQLRHSPLLVLSQFPAEKLPAFLQRLAKMATPATTATPTATATPAATDTATPTDNQKATTEAPQDTVSYLRSKLSVISKQGLMALPADDTPSIPVSDAIRQLAIWVIADLNTVVLGPSLIEITLPPPDLAPPPPTASAWKVAVSNRRVLEALCPEIPRYDPGSVSQIVASAEEVLQLAGIEGWMVSNRPRQAPTTNAWHWLAGPETWAHSRASLPDIPTPSLLGEPCDLTDYQTVLNEFPSCYGIGEDGIPSQATDATKAMVLQLKGYLLLFDQLMANQAAQLGLVPSLFSWLPAQRTFATQPPLPGPGMAATQPDKDPLFSDTPLAPALPTQASPPPFDLGRFQFHLQDFAEPKLVFRARRQAFLDHVMARYGLTSSGSPAKAALLKRIREKAPQAPPPQAPAGSSTAIPQNDYVLAGVAVDTEQAALQAVQEALLRQASVLAIDRNRGPVHSKFYLGITPESGLEATLRVRLAFPADPILVVFDEAPSSTTTGWCKTNVEPKSPTTYSFAIPVRGEILNADGTTSAVVSSLPFPTRESRDRALDDFAHQACIVTNIRTDRSASSTTDMRYHFAVGGLSFDSRTATDRNQVVASLAAACSSYIFPGPVGAAPHQADTLGLPGYDRAYQYSLFDEWNPNPFWTSKRLVQSPDSQSKSPALFDRATAWRSLEALLDAYSPPTSAPSANTAQSAPQLSDQDHALAETALPRLAQRYPWRRTYFIEHCWLTPTPAGQTSDAAETHRVTVVVAGSRLGLTPSDDSLIQAFNSILWEESPAHLEIEIVWLWEFDIWDIATLAQRVCENQPGGLASYLHDSLDAAQLEVLKAVEPSETASLQPAKRLLAPIIDQMISQGPYPALPPAPAPAAAPGSGSDPALGLPVLPKPPPSVAEQLRSEFSGVFLDSIAEFTPLYRRSFMTARLASTLPADTQTLNADRQILKSWIGLPQLDRYVESPPVSGPTPPSHAELPNPSP